MSGIPPIAPYPMPEESGLPDNVVDWVVDPDRVVLLIHDLQRYFLRPFSSSGSPLRPLLAHIAALRARFTAAGAPVAYTAQPGSMSDGDRGLLRDFWGPGMRIDSEDQRIVPPLEPAAADWVFTKWRYSAFFRSDLLAQMRAAGRDQIVVTGVYAHVGVLMTAVEAFTNDIQPFLVADAVADFSPEQHRLALEYAASRCAAVTTTDRITTAFDATEPPRLVGVG